MADETTPDQWAPWRSRIAASRKRREDRVHDWQKNVEARLGSGGRTRETYDRIDVRAGARVSVNQDWPLTKAKIAQLYSQTPEVRLSTRDERFKPAVHPFGREINETISTVDVGATIEEVLADVVNAAGSGGVLVSCEKRTEPRQVPVADPAMLPPEMQAALAMGQAEIPMETVEHTVDIQYLVQRLSPTDLLIPSDFTGSNYDRARWLGHEGRLTWAQAQREFHLTDDVKDKVVGSDRRVKDASRSLNPDHAQFHDTDVVNYCQLFYWRHFYHPEETNFRALQRMVFVDGLDQPVVDEPYRVQSRTEDGRLIGVTKNPIRILTLTYVSDEGLPPSDSSISRFTVDELEQSRTDMLLQRRHSTPLRWGDTNRISANARARLEAGDFQSFIWTNGPGDRAVGEVARASFPPEKFEIDKILKNELTEQWQVGTNQAGAFASGERSAREAGIIERNFQRRVGQEQDKVSKFFLGIVEVLAGHLALYGTFDLPDEVGPFRQELANGFTYSVRVDSTVRLDAEQQIERLTKGLNLTAQSGFVNIKPVVERIWELLGEDPSKVVIDPSPKPPEPVKLAISKAEDLDNQLFVACLVRTNQAPSPEDMAAAAKLMGARIPALNVIPEQAPEGQPSEVDRPKNAHEDWEAAGRIERRSDDGGA